MLMNVLALRSSKKGSRTRPRAFGSRPTVLLGNRRTRISLRRDTCYQFSEPMLKSHMVQFGERPSVYRGTLNLPGRRRPIRHLVVASTQLRAEGDQARIIVK